VEGTGHHVVESGQVGRGGATGAGGWAPGRQNKGSRGSRSPDHQSKGTIGRRRSRRSRPPGRQRRGSPWSSEEGEHWEEERLIDCASEEGEDQEKEG
jgi:hypothetical protein